MKAVLDAARADGLECLAGGRPLHGRDGYFVAPTIYRNAPTISVWRDEIFGPVLACAALKAWKTAVRIANDTDFGLAATVVGSESRPRPMRSPIGSTPVMSGINSPQIIFPNTAWGGFKASGIGRELGPWGLASIAPVKHVTRAG